MVELATRWEVDASHPFAALGIDETLSIDQSLHSLFGASKVAADVIDTGVTAIFWIEGPESFAVAA
jgi:hypothetical protein